MTNHDEAARVAALLARDRAEAEQERARTNARFQAENGDFTNFADTVLPPTPEWLAKHDTRPFLPKQPDGTVRVVKTVRRVLTPIVVRMHSSNKISDEMLRSCLWYREVHEWAGLEGRWSISRYSAAPSFGSAKDRRFGGAGGHMPMTTEELFARQQFRAARAAITPFYLKFFEAITLHDLPISRAWRFARCPREKAEHRFRQANAELVAYCDRQKVDLRGMRD